jgi:hypothetical protein
MADCRVYTVGSEGDLKKYRRFVCDNDNDAIVWANHLVGEIAIELWIGDRFVIRLEPKTNVEKKRLLISDSSP